MSENALQKNGSIRCAAVWRERMDETVVNRKAAKLFSETFQKIDEKTFYHKHFANPKRIEEPVYFLEKDGEMRAMNAFDQTELIVCGRTVFGAQSSDSAVKKTCRGQGLFYRIQSEFSETYKDMGGSLEFGFPNDNSYPIFINKLGWSHVGTLTEQRSPVGFMDCLKSVCFGGGRKRPKPQTKSGERKRYEEGGFTVCVAKDMELLTGEDLSVINGDMKVGVKRTAEDYRWKMSEQKEDWRLLKCEKEGRIFAYFLVLRKKSRHFLFGELIDWYVSPAAERKEYAGLKKTLRKESKGWCDILVLPYLNPQSGETETAKKLGFFLKGEGRERLIVKCFDEENLKEAQRFENWKVRKLDSDTLLNG